MAANKRKILANAQKYLQKGQLDKALKEYSTLVELDPRDANSRLKLGDIHLRQGNREEAVAAYTRVAEQFMKDGFDAKSVAIYKQIGKIDEKRYEIYEPLSELYQRLGLTSEALAALQTAADAYNREGRKRDALELLRKMATLDPTNTTSRLKIADLLGQADMPEDALAEYEAVAEEFERQGAQEELLTVYERILELDPERTSVLAAVGHTLTEQGNLERAEPFARKLVELDPEGPEGLEMMAQIYTAEGREDAASEIYQKLAQIYRNRGEDDRAREITQRFLASAELSFAGGDLDVNPEDSLVGGLGGPGDPIGSGAAGESPPPDTADAAAEHLDLGDSGDGIAGDPEQILAEANVYLRYGKADRAVQTLETLLQTEPDHRGALEKLGEAHVEAGNADQAREIWTRAAAVARSHEDEAGAAAIEERIGALGGDGGASAVEEQADLPADPSASGDGETGGETLEDIDLEIEMGDESVDTGPETLPDADATDGDLEIDVDISLPDMDAPASEPEAPSGADATVMQMDAEPSGAPDATVMQMDATAMQMDAEAPGAPDATVMQMDAEPAGSPDATVMQMDATAEETDATAMQTDDDASDVDIEVDLEIDEEESEPAVEDGDDASDSEPELELDDAAGSEAEAEAEAGDESESDTAVHGSGNSATTPEQIAENLEEADFYFNQGLYDEAEAIYRRILESAPNHPQAQLRMGEIEEARGSASGAGEEEDTPSVVVSEAADVPVEKPVDDSLGDDLADWDDDLEVEFDAGAEPPAVTAETAEDAEEGEAAEAADEDAPDQDEADASGDDIEIDLDAEEPEAEPVRDAPAETQPEIPALELDADEELPAAEDESTELEAAASDDEAAEVEEPETEESAEPEAEPEPEQEAAAEEDAEPEEAEEETAAAEAEEPEEESEATFDLAAELSDVFESNEQTETAADVGDDGFEAVFREFKKGVKEQLSESDFEAHYDLGIAYREMGLLDDAVGEFQIATGSPERALSSLHMLGLCALDLGRAEDAIHHFEQALGLPEVPDEQRAALRYDLGRAFEAHGDAARARSEYEAVTAVDPDYQDAAERLAAIEEGGGAAAAVEEEVESFESFDDLIAEAEAVLDDDAEEEPGPEAVAPDAVLEIEPEPDEAAEAEAVIEPEPAEAEAEPEPAPKKKRKKKKLSFL